jgi:DNA-binding winged helix-turn-helix (wHTH) protein
MDECAYEFGSFRLETSPRRLLRDGRALPLTPKALETLLALVRSPGRMVTKRELIETVWPDVHVEEVGLARNISALRKALGHDGERFIETWPRQGYRFVGDVTAVRATDGTGAGEARTVIAVMPFKHLDVGPEDAYLGLGIADRNGDENVEDEEDQSSPFQQPPQSC